MALAGVAAGCGSDSGAGAPEGPTAVFSLPPDGEPGRYDALPYPNDLLRVTDGQGRARVEVAGLEELLPRYTGLATQALAQQAAFGTSGAIRFRFTGVLDASSLPASPEDSVREGSAVFLARLGADGAVVERAPVEVHVDAGARSLYLRPRFALEPSARYVAVVTRDARGVDEASGRSGRVAPSEDLRAIVERSPPALADATLERARELYAEPIAAIRALPDVPRRGGIAAMTVFTTQDTTRGLLEARRQLASLAPSEVRFDRVWSTRADLDALLGDPEGGRIGIDVPGGVAHDSVALLATGSFTSPSYLTAPVAAGGFERVAVRLLRGVFDDARWVEEDGLPVLQGLERVPFAIALPASPPAGADAIPVVIFQHPTGGSRADLMSVAETLTGAGYAVVAIDAARQGTRYSDDDEESNFTGAAGADGFADASLGSSVLGIFEALSNVLAIRDNLRQTVVDQMALARWLRDPGIDLSAIGGPPLDRERLYFVSKSLGSLVGVPFLALEPSVVAGMLTVGGAGFANELLASSAEIAASVPLFGAIADIEGLCVDRFEPLTNLVQGVVDPGDPRTWARHVLLDPLPRVDGRPGVAKHVLLTESIGDQTVGNAATELLAREMGVELATPSARAIDGLAERASPLRGNLLPAGGERVTGALVQWHPAGHAVLDKQTSRAAFAEGVPFPCPDRYPRREGGVRIIDNPIEAIQEQMLRFLESARLAPDGVPEIVLTAPPRPAG